MWKIDKPTPQGSPPMRFLGNLSLGTRIMLLTALGLLVGASLLTVPGLNATNEATEMMLEDRLTTAQVVADSLDELLRLCINVLEDSAQSVTSAAVPLDLEQQLQAVSSAYSHLSIKIDSVYLIDDEDRIASSQPETRNVSESTLNAFISMVKRVDGNQTAISGLVPSPVTQSPVVLIIHNSSVASASQDHRFVVAIDPVRSGFVGFVRPVRFGNTGYVEVVDQSGIVVVRTEPGPKIAPFEKSDHSGHFGELIASGKPTRGLCHTCHIATEKVTTRDVLAFVPLSVARWGVVIRQSEQEALAPIRKLRLEVMLSGLGLVIVAFIMAAVTARDVSNRVKALTGVSSRIASGDFDSPVLSTRKDEVGMLAQTLDSMRSRLKTSYAEIERRTRELSSLLAVSEVLASLPNLSDLKEALGNTLDRALEIIKVDISGLLLWNEEKNLFHYLAYRGLSPDYADNAVYQMNDVVGTESSESGDNITVNELAENTGNLLQRHLYGQGIKTLITIPLRSTHGMQDILLLAHREQRELTREDTRLLEGIARYIGTALENARLHQEVQRKEAIRGELLQDMLSVQEEERKRIARELHDETSQVLASMNANIQAALSTMHTHPEKSEALLKKVQAMSVSILDNINKLIYQLRPSLLDDMGLVAAIRWLANNNLKGAGVNVRQVTKGRRRRLNHDVETAIFRTVQEAFNNIVRHAHAPNVTVTLRFTEGLVAVSVEDDGIGFDVEEALHTKARPRGLGLLGMRERIELIGGKISIHSRHAEGTQIRIEVPEEKETHDG
ncbi:MAG: histidine kinase [Dehalococcoidia bacterium]|nr:histidine kinase [Dehalococcoidia bacterium]